MKTTKAINKKSVLITGGTGFVGRELIRQLNERNDYSIQVAVRNDKSNVFSNNEKIMHIQDIATHSDWREALKDCNVVIHAAARVHVMKEGAGDSLSEYRRVNVDATLNLARQAAEQGIKRFIFISSIKVNGEETQRGHAYNSDDIPTPKDPYAISKYEAEQGLLALAAATNMEIVIIRPPLVYGPGVKGNFQRMMQCLQKGYPLPLKTVNNKRSLVSVYNLVDLIIHCMEHPQAANQVFLVSDGNDLSTIELLHKIGKVMNKPVRLIPAPLSILNATAKLVGKQDVLRRLFGSLQVDIGKTSDLLGWKPQMSTDEALRRTTQDFV